jgi:hypothetical protein
MRLRVDSPKVLQDNALVEPQFFFQAAMAMAAMDVAITAIAKLFY